MGAVAGFNQEEWYTYRYTGAKAQGILTPNIPVINLLLAINMLMIVQNIGLFVELFPC